MKKTMIALLAAFGLMAATPSGAEASSFSISIGNYAPVPYAYGWGYRPHHYHPPVRVVKHYYPRTRYYVQDRYYDRRGHDRHRGRGHYRH